MLNLWFLKKYYEEDDVEGECLVCWNCKEDWIAAVFKNYNIIIKYTKNIYSGRRRRYP